MSYNAFDCFRPDLVVKNATRILSAGYVKVGLYYFESSAFKILLNKAYAEELSKLGFDIFSIYENGSPINASYFSEVKGVYDAKVAVSRATQATQPLGTPIYFAVDYDASQEEFDGVIKPYFAKLQPLVKEAGYLAGCYGNGLVLQQLIDLGFISHDYLSQSKGFTDYQTILANHTPCIVQGEVSTLCGIDVDWDNVQDSAGCWSLSA